MATRNRWPSGVTSQLLRAKTTECGTTPKSFCGTPYLKTSVFDASTSTTNHVDRFTAPAVTRGATQEEQFFAVAAPARLDPAARRNSPLAAGWRNTLDIHLTLSAGLVRHVGQPTSVRHKRPCSSASGVVTSGSGLRLPVSGRAHKSDPVLGSTSR